jgi:hypothetical protein
MNTEESSAAARAQRAVSEAATRSLEQNIDTIRKVPARIAHSGDPKLVDQAVELAVKLRRNGYL